MDLYIYTSHSNIVYIINSTAVLVSLSWGWGLKMIELQISVMNTHVPASSHRYTALTMKNLLNMKVFASDQKSC